MIIPIPAHRQRVQLADLCLPKDRADGLSRRLEQLRVGSEIRLHVMDRAESQDCPLFNAAQKFAGRSLLDAQQSVCEVDVGFPQEVERNSGCGAIVDLRSVHHRLDSRTHAPQRRISLAAAVERGKSNKCYHAELTSLVRCCVGWRTGLRFFPLLPRRSVGRVRVVERRPPCVERRLVPPLHPNAARADAPAETQCLERRSSSSRRTASSPACPATSQGRSLGRRSSRLSRGGIEARGRSRFSRTATANGLSEAKLLTASSTPGGCPSRFRPSRDREASLRLKRLSAPNSFGELAAASLAIVPLAPADAPAGRL
ncbi:hypothetical protein J2X36_002164 [Methylobacterium sp. BE186]|nr:hypothetical protein [Methylobacterium sp. BE186]